MTAPRIEIDLDAIGHNTRVLVDRLAGRGIQVTAVTKAVLGHPEVARALVGAGVRTLGDSRMENIEAMRRAGVEARMSLIRSPMASQAERVVASADRSHNTELSVVSALSAAAVAHARPHGVVLMVELGDLREGIMPEDLESFVEAMWRLPNLRLDGIGTNLACRNGVVPSDRNMRELSQLVESVESRFDRHLSVVSGGNSASIEWALTTDSVGRVNDLRLGEAILLGREPLHRHPLKGLRTDAFTIVAEVIESKRKPAQPWGEIAQAAFGTPQTASRTGKIVQSLLALGEQDVDPAGLVAPTGVHILGASSDHLVVTTEDLLVVGTTIRLAPNYSALLRAMTSPFVTPTTLAPVTRGHGRRG